MAPTPHRISTIQEALAKDGSFTSTPNGKWDDTTVEAMKKFQGAHGLNPSGKLDARTLEKLGLGSQTAGIAEPVAPPNSPSWCSVRDSSVVTRKQRKMRPGGPVRVYSKALVEANTNIMSKAR